ncbi:MAG: flagellar protein FlaG [Alphaproteobacteria bacterium]|jgi:flagellar protein FlaG|nr:flagellar protein FlaG [Alphaproteobacteria bacterium]MBU2042567.1 flagellar protein FlaG [Alphaproteobacteria bacterium]MBU2126460.1 flagellar protein FlaG [Alphaproteobacteria bacterium]MBU2209612.1 flagellar protein FlaG [Alphaproteobacteria bacterium]MBU2292279.1 flagellar protein FlaG [Alphaproteobacteria bacterium]
MNADASIRAVPAVKAETPLPSGSDHQSNSRGAADAERQARYRLVIEQGPQAGSFVYKTLDRETGEVVQQLPSEEVLKMRQREGYGVGSVINTAV